jgi:peptidoglycan/xylan/chitin deacetylase (PgdA/CDA1 family)
MRQKTGIKKEAYWGSVRFFRHFIYLFIFGVVLSPYLFMVMFFYQNKLLRSEIDDLRSVVLEIAPSSNKTKTDEFRPIVSTLKYQKKYPDLYCAPQTVFVKKEKTIYLTFDDGPSRYTESFLDILAKHNIKATFFVVGRNDPKSKEILKRIVKEGHTIAPHTYTHVYKEIYATVDSFLDDFKRIHDLIYETTGVNSNILRFPGGTVNVYNRRIYRELSAEMLRRGYTFFDWNVSAADADKNATVDSVIKNVINGVHENGINIVLMHDVSAQTLKALGETITLLKKKGFAFDRLTNEVAPVTFYYNYLKEGGV